MKTSEIRDLIDFISKSGLNEVNIETKELKLQVKREPDQKVFKSTSVVAPVAAAPVATAAPVASAASAPAPASKAPAASSDSGKKTIEIKSPMIGTFYRSSGPDAAPFVSVGDKISKGQTVCIIEAMKLFNEIESEVSGTVVRVMVENSTPVEYDQVLFVVEPD
ncbi:acetyl-CoA carboxylase biotin carboxyl carrier protein [Fulvivirgaceae bacterium PWU4]|uniref:Biotin carboxyl carrier protein of acetyl-CoA carboxylase n=1 Tax=Chryseosolibacter histidini TaxID=2782349 RepID=A0AAP2DN16_9BACT|nr:acetyl-CoA carboxylase biotin carboxyl carrier protein [Chryseosolibacter histidini]MBT1699376.1 acetyl-CoA carboxylase biotin carboxyl carrier protein [Chryseosolibacter histidini]